jgi:tetratricopeptide (TPR) repeat protein
LRNSVELSLKIPFNFQIFDQFLMDLCTLGQGKWSLSQAFGPYHQALSRGKFSEALKCLEGLPQNQRRNPNLLWRRAHIQSLTGHPQAALALFERCLQLSPFLVPAHYYATELLARFQEIERAKLFAQNAVLLCPNHLQLRSLAQRVLRLPERKEELS